MFKLPPNSSASPGIQVELSMTCVPFQEFISSQAPKSFSQLFTEQIFLVLIWLEQNQAWRTIFFTLNSHLWQKIKRRQQVLRYVLHKAWHRNQALYDVILPVGHKLMTQQAKVQRSMVFNVDSNPALSEITIIRNTSAFEAKQADTNIT